MTPLIVVTLGHPRRSRRFLDELARQFRHRGLRLKSLDGRAGQEAYDCDVLLARLQPRSTRSLAKDLEQIWMEEWNLWYGSSRWRTRKR